MIGKLTGKVDAIGESVVILDVGGVGYEVLASARTLRNLQVGAGVSLTIDTHVREDAIQLYGFSTELERTWFRTLQEVQGVGGKVALAILNALSPAELATAIMLGDWGAFRQKKACGEKTAQLIVVKLKNKVPKLAIVATQKEGAREDRDAVAVGVPQAAAQTEAMSALINLGYKPEQAAKAVAVAARELGDDAATAPLIRRALKELSRL
ncbi:MAG: Holliday junction branch migration protein RuvA [Hyphomicrobiaceae bacterium]|nr:Holliday junction branch migration protein RuvA [Hyphomicrobiaceae bacterium]